ncbi:unnamed protein product [Periconia digitata]|uniref:Zn(2)-C6 fungal-type domain-containing protein n=1 Tax=Periconia digitata TaxID=1303443 RepID=A0A9W4UMD5_9PLEO|nr:unnamed protein product [Periconia digitata]
MPKDAPKPRQRPISCRFCRTRKLRCSRDSPCSNCVSRNIPCELEKYNDISPSIENREREELLERIRKLEAFVGSKSAQVTGIAATSTPDVDTQSQSYAEQNAGPFDQVKDQRPGEDVASAKEQFDHDCAYLKSIYDNSDSTPDELPSTTVTFCVCPLNKIIITEEPMKGSCFSHTRIIFWLPEYSQALALLDKFKSSIHHMHHIMLSQSLSDVLDRVYASLNQKGEVKSGDMILLYAILTAAMHTWSADDCCKRGLFTTPEEAHKHSAIWIKATEHLLEIAQRTTKMSIEGIEGIIVIGFIVSSYKGFSRRCWHLMNNAILHARELGLHRIDHPSNSESSGTANAEVGRRLWWYLVATDWAMSAKFNGAARGTYQCHPRQMMTDKPLNIDDEDVVDGMSRVGKPSSQPTSMSYFLFRIRLNEISRSLVDRTPFMSVASSTSFEVVMDIDTEMQKVYADIPAFFSLPPADTSRIYNISYARALSIARQGNDLYALFNAQRCRLHLPYAQRGYVEPEFAPSRDLCINSARLIIRNETAYYNSDLGEGGSRYVPLFYSMTVFLACTVLLMDYSHSRSATHRDKQKLEICSAVRLLESARLESELAAKFMDSMITVLHKHGIALNKQSVAAPTNSSSRTTQKQDRTTPSMLYDTATGASAPSSEFQHGSYMGAMAGQPVALPDTPLSVLENNTLASQGLDETDGGVFNSMQTGGSDLGDLVMALDQGVDVGMIDWDDIFIGLEPSFM